MPISFEDTIKDYFKIALFTETVENIQLTDNFNWDQIIEKYEDMEEEDHRLKELTDSLFSYFYDYLDDNIIEIASAFVNGESSKISFLHNETRESEMKEVKELILELLNKKYLKNINEIKKFKDFK